MLLMELNPHIAHEAWGSGTQKSKVSGASEIREWNCRDLKQLAVGFRNFWEDLLPVLPTNVCSVLHCRVRRL